MMNSIRVPRALTATLAVAMFALPMAGCPDVSVTNQDSDSDGVIDDVDVCPTVADPDQIDSDGDGQGDSCDADDDNDGVLDTADNCAVLPNANQDDADADGLGDPCDTDRDGDGLANGVDNCPDVTNPTQVDADGDGTGDACDNPPDADSDGVVDTADNCPEASNSDQLDTDTDGIGDACDGDDDGDEVLDADDCAPLNADVLGCSLWYADEDGDTFGDGDKSTCACFPAAPYTSTSPTDCDDTDDEVSPSGVESCDGLDTNCNNVADDGYPDLDEDGEADCVDDDDDGDGVADTLDNCPVITNPTQNNADGAEDGGDACDDDDDDDGLADSADNCPTVANADQIDDNENGLGDACEPDWDGDGVLNDDDNCPWDANDDQINTDLTSTDTVGDEFGDACDSDDDDDQVVDDEDCAPTNFAVNPNANEVCGDAIDNDCSGAQDDGDDPLGCQLFYKDGDNDDWGDTSTPGQCLCQAQGQFKVLVVGDCDDTDDTVNAAATETCNGKDDDCKNGVDDLWSTLGDACDGDDPDSCEDGAFVCNGGGDGVVCNDGPTTPSAQEVCNGADDNCNGVVDEDFPTLGDPCDGNDADQCKNGSFVCNGSGTGVTCGVESGPSVSEVCNGLDDDCDGSTDEGNTIGDTWYRDFDGDGKGDPNNTTKGCNQPSGFVANSSDCEDHNEYVWFQCVWPTIPSTTAQGCFAVPPTKTTTHQCPDHYDLVDFDINKQSGGGSYSQTNRMWWAAYKNGYLRIVQTCNGLEGSLLNITLQCEAHVY